MPFSTATAKAATRDKLRDPVWQSATLLRVVLGVAALVTGTDKFFNILTNWSMYLAPVAYGDAPLGGQPFMYMVGVIEISLGLLIIFLPRYGSLLFAGWLGLIILNLFLVGSFDDIALRDFGLVAASLALFRLTFYRTPIPVDTEQENSHARNDLRTGQQTEPQPGHVWAH